MTTGITTLLRKSSTRTGRMLLATSIIVAAPLLTADDQIHPGHDTALPAKLVQTVRNATLQYVNVNAATAAGYQPFLGCVSGPDHGAMGQHYVNFTLYGDGQIDAAHPEALIYESWQGRLQLVGVEYIVDAAAWLAKNTAPPVLQGQTFLFVDSPNRFGIPAFFELHVWAWRDNPQGAFVDWNNDVTCEGQ